MSFKLLWIGPESTLRKESVDLGEKKGWEISVCPSGLLGVDKAQKMKPDLVVIDHELSDCQSLSVVRNIRSAPIGTEKQILIFVLIAGSLADKVERELDKWEGQAYFVRLPIDPKQLITWLENPSLVKKLSEKKIESKEEIKEIPQKEMPQEKIPVDENVEPEVGEMKKETEIKHKKKDHAATQEVSTLKDYIDLKEKEILELQLDLKRAKDQLELTSKRSSEMDYEYTKMKDQVQDFQKKLELLTRENEDFREQHAKELKSREQEIQTKADKILMAERKYDVANKKFEELRERVRRDIQQIRVHEKELEARLEILKKDSETLIQAKDKKLLEFKRKMDALEYELEIVREREAEATRKVKFWRDRMDRVLRALRLGSSLLESDEDLEEFERSSIDIKKTQKAA